MGTPSYLPIVNLLLYAVTWSVLECTFCLLRWVVEVLASGTVGPRVFQWLSVDIQQTLLKAEEREGFIEKQQQAYLGTPPPHIESVDFHSLLL